MFVDLKAAFNMVDKERIWRQLRVKGILKRTITMQNRKKSRYAETECKVRVNGAEREVFKHEKE